jgi:integrase
LAGYREKLREQGHPVREPKFKMRQASEDLAWIHKSLSDVTTLDIEHFIKERLEVVQPATVDREIDRLKAIFKVALTVWDYHLAKNPMDAVRRPKFFNERDRRISPDEESRLLAALAELDFERAVDIKLQELAEQGLADHSFSSNSARKKQLASIRANLRSQAEALAEVEPYLQAFYLFQVMTAARRGETLGLTWDLVSIEDKTALLPETKNGRSRKLSLRDDLLDVLEQLPQDTHRVFAVGVDYIVGSWNKACRTAGIEDLHIHDCRHEAISRVAESGKFTIPDLQVFSGHQDVRMLMRYAHLCAKRLAAKLDECFKDEAKVRVHRGRRLLGANSTVKVRDVLDAELFSESEVPAVGAVLPHSAGRGCSRESTRTAAATATAASKATSNVIAFPSRKRA